MRYNEKELMAVASQPAIKCDKEGVLYFRDKQEGFFRKNEGKLILYRHLNNQRPCSLLLLCQCCISMQIHS